jgi:hypothetical protein
MSKRNRLLNKNSLVFKVDFLGNDEVTGTTLFATHKLKEVNGYDEFYVAGELKIQTKYCV